MGGGREDTIKQGRSRLPVSYAQQRMWFVDQLQPESAAYNVPAAFRLRGSLDIGSIGRALSEIVARHEPLRTTFVAVDGLPHAVVADPEPVELPLIDLTGAADPEGEARCRVVAEADAPFDLAHGPLVRAVLLQLAQDEHVLVVTMHHSVTDGWSAGLFAEELSVLYDAYHAGRQSPLADLAEHYSDFVAWQREALRGDALEALLSYWRAQMHGCPPILELPTDHSRPAVRRGRGATVPVVIPATVVDGLGTIARTGGATLFMVLLAAFQILLARYSGQDDFAVGCPIAGRNRASTERMIGFFVNTLALRADLSGDPTFTELLARVRDVALGAYDHQDLPFELLVQALHPDRNLSHTPVFQHLFVFQTQGGQLILPGIGVSAFPVDRDASMFDLTLDLGFAGGRVVGRLEYDTDLFDRETAAALVTHYLRVLGEAVTDPGRPVSELPLLDAAERHQLLVTFNDTASAFPCQTIHGRFEDCAARRPDDIAVRDAHGALSYGELNEAANRLAHYLRGLGVEADTRVAICLPRGSAVVVAMLAVLKAGGGYVPLDCDYPRERLAFMVNDTGAAVVVTTSSLLDRLPDHAADFVCLDTAGEILAAQPPNNPVPNDSMASLAYVIYTSGSTGRPKGVMIEHRGVVSLMAAARTTFTDGELQVVVAAASLCFDLSVFEIFAPLTNGGSIYLAADLLDLDWHRVEPTMLTAVPSVLASVLADNDLPPSLVTVILAGEALSWDLVRTIRERTSVGASPLRLINIYGPTETTIYATSASIDAAAHGSGIVEIGRPVPNCHIYILDRCLRPVPIGVSGELYIGGIGVGRGYVNRPELDAERFVADPFAVATPSRMYRTGDTARYRRDGAVEYLGRSDDQLKIRGFRVEPEEIRAALVALRSVSNAAVVLREDVPGQRLLVGYVVANPEAVTASSLRAELEGVLPRYMIPTAFVILDALPCTVSGKLDRSALPPPGERLSRQARVAPRTETERALARIWAEVLGIASVGVTDDFFELGGHSLLAARVVARAERTFGQRLPMAVILRTGTIEALARVIDTHDPEPLWRTVFPLRLGGSGVPVFCVHGLTGTVTAYRRIIPYLSDDHDVYGIQSHGLDGRTEPHHRVEDMAAHYLAEVQTVQPRGPYVIIGICFGSLVAFEMAHQLASRGLPVALVALIDPTPLPERTFVEKAKRRYAKFSRAPVRDWIPFVTETVRVTAEMAGVKARAALHTKTKDVVTANTRATSLYTPPHYSGQVTVYRSGGLRTDPHENRAAAWDTLVGDNVTVVDIDGASHQSLLTECNIPTVASHLRDSIGRAVQELQ